MAPHLDNSHRTPSTTSERISRRKVMKHMVEKRRRNKMNNLLEDMKTLVLQGMNKDPSQYEKMEKADILEMTLQFLISSSSSSSVGKLPKSPSVYMPPMPMVPMSPSLPIPMPNYGLGYQSCLSEAKRYLQTAPLPSDVTSRLVGHLEASMASTKSRRCSNTVTKVPKEFEKELEISIPSDARKQLANVYQKDNTLLKVKQGRCSQSKNTAMYSVDPRRYALGNNVVGDTDINNNVAIPHQVAVGAVSPQWRPW